MSTAAGAAGAGAGGFTRPMPFDAATFPVSLDKYAEELRATAAARGAGGAGGGLGVAISRVSQLDALLLEEQLHALLERQLARALGDARAGRWRPELRLALRGVAFAATVARNRPRPGDALQNLRYRNERLFAARGPTSTLLRLPGDGPTRAQRAGWLALAVLCPYAWARLRAHARSHDWANAPPNADGTPSARARAWAWFGRLEAGWRWASLLHLLAFLRNGRYRAPAERALRMRLVYDRPNEPRMLSFDLLNRELVWPVKRFAERIFTHWG